MRQARAAFGLVVRGGVLAALAALACGSCPLRAQEVYKSVDADGHVVYSDRGNTKTAPKTTVRVEQPDPAEAARLAKEQELLKAEDSERTRQQAHRRQEQGAAGSQQAAGLRERPQLLLSLKDTGRLYKRDADGNRVFYSDEEADGMREQARQAMVGACGT